MLHVAIGVLINSQKQILVAKRALHKHQGGLWEFPGGKVENNETVFEALQRELQEELSIEVVAAKPFLKSEYHYDDRHVFLDVWIVFEYNGIPQSTEGQAIKWIFPQDLSLSEIPTANHGILQKLKELLS